MITIEGLEEQLEGTKRRIEKLNEEDKNDTNYPNDREIEELVTSRDNIRVCLAALYQRSLG